MEVVKTVTFNIVSKYILESRVCFTKVEPSLCPDFLKLFCQKSKMTSPVFAANWKNSAKYRENAELSANLGSNKTFHFFSILYKLKATYLRIILPEQTYGALRNSQWSRNCPSERRTILTDTRQFPEGKFAVSLLL